MIAHDSEVQRNMDLHRLSWGVQYEIARGVSDGRWTWAHVSRDKILKLRPDSDTTRPDNIKALDVSIVITGKSQGLVTDNERKMWYGVITNLLQKFT